MSYVDFNASKNFKDILHLLVDKNNFAKYIDDFPFQTCEMKEKNTLSIRAPYNDQIVCVEKSNVSYVDDAYYKNHLHEDTENPQNTNFPIKMTALRVDWIINDPNGKKFLQALCNSENQELLNSQSVIVIVEFLYKNYRSAVLMQSLPFYVI